MKRSTKRAVLATLAAVAMAGTLAAVVTLPASAEETSAGVDNSIPVDEADAVPPDDSDADDSDTDDGAVPPDGSVSRDVSSLAAEAAAAGAVDCAGRDDFLRLTVHVGSNSGLQKDFCWASAGTYWFPRDEFWVTKIHTGNNRVKWNGDGRWQPDDPINENTDFTWPRHQRGVRVDAVQIF